MYKFTIDDTNIIKGIAVIFLLCNHYCVVNDWIIAPNELWDVFIKGKPLLGYLGAFGKICVALWAFLSGIGAYYTYRNLSKGLKVSFVRLINLMIQYLLILSILFVPMIYLLQPKFVGQAYDFSMPHILYNVFACDAEYNKAAWYLRFYIMFVLTMPIYLWIKSLLKKDIVFYMFTATFLLFFPKLFSDDYMIGSVPCHQFVGEYCNYMLIVLSGYFIAEYNVFERFQYIGLHFPIIGRAVFLILIILAAMAVRSYAKGINFGFISIYTDIIITPFVVYAIFRLFQYVKQTARNVFVYIGKASMVVWLSHWIFNIGNYELQSIAYMPRISYLVIFWILLLCLAFNEFFSFMIKRLHLKITVKR